VPRYRGPGKGNYEHEVLIWSRPRRSFGYFPIAGKVPRRRSGELPKNTVPHKISFRTLFLKKVWGIADRDNPLLVALPPSDVHPDGLLLKGSLGVFAPLHGAHAAPGQVVLP